MKKMIFLVTAGMMLSSGALAERERLHFEQKAERAKTIWDETLSKNKQIFANGNELPHGLETEDRLDNDSKVD